MMMMMVVVVVMVWMLVPSSIGHRAVLFIICIFIVMIISKILRMLDTEWRRRRCHPASTIQIACRGLWLKWFCGLQFAVCSLPFCSLSLQFAVCSLQFALYGSTF
jgi:hypothetical protein